MDYREYKPQAPRYRERQRRHDPAKSSDYPESIRPVLERKLRIIRALIRSRQYETERKIQVTALRLLTIINPAVSRKRRARNN